MLRLVLNNLSDLHSEFLRAILAIQIPIVEQELGKRIFGEMSNDCKYLTMAGSMTFCNVGPADMLTLPCDATACYLGV